MPSSNVLTFNEACEYLALGPAEVVALREQGLIAAFGRAGDQEYPKSSLELTQRLLRIGTERGWSTSTLAWYADLIFATEVGRSILIPIPDENIPYSDLPESWLATPYVDIVLSDLEEEIEQDTSPFIILLRSLLAVAVGEGQFWPDEATLRASDLGDLLAYLETRDIRVLNQVHSVARDAGPIFLGVMLVFTAIAPPISIEFSALIQQTRGRLKVQSGPLPSLKGEQTRIKREELVAVDKLYAAKAVEIHTPPEQWDFRLGIVSAKRRTITLQMKVPPETPEAMIDNVIDLIRPFIGAYGARVVHLLYEIANDPPYWRNPMLTISTNDILDRLGQKRDKHGFHQSRNRERLRDALNTAHTLEIVGQYTLWENGKPITKAFFKPVLSLIGATFDPAEIQGIPSVELRQKGLPKTVQLRLNFYDGVRRPDGSLGDHYVLMPRLAEPKKLLKANYSRTSDLLRAFFLVQYRQSKSRDNSMTFTRELLLEKANIKNKNASRATMTLHKALDTLVSDGTLESFSNPLPTKPSEVVEITLSKSAAKM
jgi:hypothetical protein